ncbi:MAG: hypothetical protein HOC91_06495 [Nitrospinaceae bacterium]|nr:hypothetical protein [Nitrospinaceae bacterium]
MVGKNAGRTLLFLSRDAGGVKSIIPVIESMSGRADVDTVVISHPLSRFLYEERNIQSKRLEDTGYFENPDDVIFDILRRIQPDVVVSGSSMPSPEEPVTVEQRLVKAARECQVPTILLQDTWAHFLERFSTDGKTIDLEVVPDKICVLDVHAFNDLEKIGVPRSRLSVTHNPWYDGVVSESKKLSKISRQGVQILFASQPIIENKPIKDWGYTQESLFKELLGSLDRCSSFDGKEILVWVHPRECSTRWSPSSLRIPESIQVTITEDRSAEILKNVDFIVTGHSTVVYEALYYDTPCISLRIGGSSQESLFTDDLGLTTLIETRGELDRYLREEQYHSISTELNRKRKELSKDNVFFSDGKAAGRVLDIIWEVIDR